MEPKKLDFNVVSQSVDIVKGKLVSFLVAGMATALLSSVLGWLCSLLIRAVGHNPLTPLLLPGAAVLSDVALMSLLSPVFAGLMHMGLRAAQGEPVKAAHAFRFLSNPTPFLVGGLVVSLATALGFACFVLPGFVIAGLSMFTLLFMADQKLAPFDAFKASLEALKSQWVSATMLALVAGVVCSVGMVACYVGLFFTLPLGATIIALAYRDVVLGRSTRIQSDSEVPRTSETTGGQ